MEIKIENKNLSYGEWCNIVVEKIFKHHFKKNLEIKEIDHESDSYRRIFIKTTKNSYFIRLWNFIEKRDYIILNSWTLFEDIIVDDHILKTIHLCEYNGM